MAKPITKPLLNLGDRVRIRYGNGMHGKIVELRGSLGPNGEQAYRVRMRRQNPPAKFIDLLETQLILLPPKT